MTIFTEGVRGTCPAATNAPPAGGALRETPDAVALAQGVMVFTLTGDRICAMTRFETGVLPWFAFPPTLPG